jgi:hypothetical protein
MNGKAAKRIRIVARTVSKPETYRRTVQQLKREYRELPYHKRVMPSPPHSAFLKPRMMGHSAFLKAFHVGQGHAGNGEQHV